MKSVCDVDILTVSFDLSNVVFGHSVVLKRPDSFNHSTVHIISRYSTFVCFLWSNKFMHASSDRVTLPRNMLD